MSSYTRIGFQFDLTVVLMRMMIITYYVACFTWSMCKV